MELLDKIVLKIKENSYAATYPNVGQKIRIQSLKQDFTGGQYGRMSDSLLQDQWDALEMVDVLAHFTVLIPDLVKDSKVSMSNLDQRDFVDLIKVYREQFLPWYKGWEEVIKKVRDEVK